MMVDLSSSRCSTSGFFASDIELDVATCFELFILRIDQPLCSSDLSDDC